MYVIAGVTGHVGSVVAKDLLDKGQKVKVLVRDRAKGAAWEARGATVAVGELGDKAFLTGALSGAQGFFTLLPPDFGVADLFAYQRELADTIAAAVQASKVPHVVMLSSLGADLEEGTGPIRGLHYLEDKLRAAGTKVTAVRASYFQENVQNGLGPARSAGIYPNFSSSADAAFPMIATHDLGVVAADALRNPPSRSETVDVVGPLYTSKQVAEKLSRALGKQVRVQDVPEAGWVNTMVKAGFPPSIARSFAEMYQAFDKGRVQPHGDRMIQGKTEIDQVIAGLVQ